MAVIYFDDNARILLPLSPLSRKQGGLEAADSLRNYSGGTHMAKGLRCAERELSGLPSSVAKRILLLTDGQTFDEAECRPVAGRFAESNTPLIAIGVESNTTKTCFGTSLKSVRAGPIIWLRWASLETSLTTRLARR